MENNVVITISREYGSGGYTIGKRIAELLHIPFYDRDDIAEMVKKEPLQSALTSEWLKAKKLRPGSKAIGSPFGAGAALGDLTSQLFLQESNAVWKMAKQGPCVIVGRCADFVLQGEPHTYRVFLSSGMARRLRQIHANPDLYGAAAKKEAKDIMHMDKKRASYYNYYTGQLWGKASNYDLCIDTGKLGPMTAELIIEYIRRAEELTAELTEA